MHAAKFYDLLVSKGDLKFYRDLALQSSRSALELGVGTGRVAISLARAGLNVVASMHMLSVAKEGLAEEPGSVRRRIVLKTGDMRKFELKQTFPFIYSRGRAARNTLNRRTRSLSWSTKSTGNRETNDSLFP